MNKSLTLALALAALAVCTSLSAGQRPQQMDKAAPPKTMTGTVTQVNGKDNSFTISVNGREATFSAKMLRVLPKVGNAVDVTYTQTPGGPMEATTVNPGKGPLPEKELKLREGERELEKAKLEAQHIILKERLKELNETKRSQLEKLRALNILNKFMSDQIKKIAEASQKLAEREKASDDSATEKVSLKWEKPKIDRLDENGNVVVDETRSKSHNRNSLGTEMKIAENCMEEIRNKKQMEQTAFEHIDKTTNETMNTISRVLRALGEMRQEGAAKRGGL